MRNMDPLKFKELQASLNKEETRLKTFKADIDPSKLSELANVDETLNYWQQKLQSFLPAIDHDNGGGLKLLTQPKQTIEITGLENIDIEACSRFTTLKREIMDKLQTKMVIFKDRIEIHCQIPMDRKFFNLILPLELQAAG
jgi:hypothetical protein